MSEQTRISKRVKGKEYRYYDVGIGDTTVVLLHGLANSAELMLFACDVFGPNYRVIIPEIPGHMGMPMYGIESLGDLAGYYRDLFLCLELENYFLGGYSLGGLISLKYSEMYGARGTVKGVMCWASPVFGTTLKAKVLGEVVKLLPSGLFSVLEKPAFIPKAFRLIRKRLDGG